jgi:CHAD domain-containing protein
LNTSFQFQLPEGYTREQVEILLAEQYTFKVEEPVSTSWALYDTFDWRLFKKSLTLHQLGQWFFLRSLPDGQALHRILPAAAPKFAQDFPDSPLKEDLQTIIDPRALLKLCELTTKSYAYRILNRDKKTVARLVYTAGWTIPDTSSAARVIYLNLLPVRGYPKYTRGLTAHLESAGLSFSNWQDLYFSALEAVGQDPGSYSSKIDVQLEPGMRADEATKIILHRLLQVIRANQAGIKADIDVEFLHDYRVAIRRTRSALSQIKNVFPVDITHQFKQDFAYLGKLTNELRDLDVYLLSEELYRSMLPAVLRDDINPLFDYLRAQRKQTLEAVITSFDQERSKRILLNWKTFLREPVPETRQPAGAMTPIIELARKRIYKHYRRIIKDGQEILKSPQDELMHALRIECKKLRYLIEFFASLFPPKKVRQLVDQLKQLQDNLGDFNDLSIQQEYLLSIAAELPASDNKSRRALLATGSLVESLANRQQAVKEDFAETFTNFASTENQDLYEQLFSDKRSKTTS